jgi:SAM-dependent methyltransferase
MLSIDEYYEQYWQNPAEYADPTTPIRQELLQRFLRMAPIGGSILDLGCGAGGFCEFFRSLGFQVEGSDLSRAAIEHARKTYPDITFHVGEVETLLPSKESQYDVVFSSEVIEHLFDVGGWLGATNKLMKTDGLLMLTTPFHGILKNIAIDIFGYSKHYDPLGQHIRFFDKAGLARCLNLTGFTPLAWTGFGRPWPFWKSMFVVARKTQPFAGLSFGTQGRLS